MMAVNRGKRFTRFDAPVEAEGAGRPVASPGGAIGFLMAPPAPLGGARWKKVRHAHLRRDDGVPVCWRQCLDGVTASRVTNAWPLRLDAIVGDEVLRVLHRRRQPGAEDLVARCFGFGELKVESQEER